MSQTKPVEGATVQAPAKKARRGVSNKTQAVAQLRFHEKDADPRNGLFVGNLDEVKVEWSTNEENKDFPGMAVPRIQFHFTSTHVNATEKRHVYQTAFAVASNVDTIPNGAQSWKVDNVLRLLKHMLDVFYLKGRELTESEEDALALPFEDFDEEGNYVVVDPEEVLKGYATVFTNVVAMLNGEFELAEGEVAKPCFKTADGKPVKVWMKLLRHKKTKNGWVNVTQNGELGFDGFIGNGIVELLKKDVAPTLRLDLAKESITPKETKKEPTLGGPNMMGGGMAVIGNDMAAFGAMPNPAFDAASNDMPY